MFERMARNASPALGETFSVTVFAARRDLGAARYWVPRGIRPLDCASISHAASLERLKNIYRARPRCNLEPGALSATKSRPPRRSNYMSPGRLRRRSTSFRQEEVNIVWPRYEPWRDIGQAGHPKTTGCRDESLPAGGPFSTYTWSSGAGGIGRGLPSASMATKTKRAWVTCMRSSEMRGRRQASTSMVMEVRPVLTRSA